MSAFSRAHLARWWQLILALGCLGLTGYCASLLVDQPLFGLMLIWFGAVVVGNDLVLLPLLALADRALTGCSRWWRSGRSATASAVNHIRVPVLGSGLLLLMFFPGIVQQGAETHLAATGLDQQPYLARWCWISAALAATSAALYVLRLLRARRRISGQSGDEDESSESARAQLRFDQQR